jgi:hypothetical protein
MANIPSVFGTMLPKYGEHAGFYDSFRFGYALLPGKGLIPTLNSTSDVYAKLKTTDLDRRRLDCLPRRCTRMGENQF